MADIESVVRVHLMLLRGVGVGVEIRVKVRMDNLGVFLRTLMLL